MKKKTGRLLIIITSLLSSLSLNAQTLSDALQHALSYNPEILSNRAKSLAAREAVRQASGELLPSIDIEAGYGNEKTNNPVTNTIGGSSTNIWMERKEFNVRLTQNLFSGFGNEGEIKRHLFLWQAQEYKTIGLSEDLALEVTKSYLDVMEKERLLAYAEDNLSEHRRIFSMIEHRSSAGISRQAEMEQARGRLALANANLLSARNDLSDARITFRRVVGERARGMVWPSIPVKGDMPKNLPSAIQKGLDSHPTLLSAYADIKEAKAQYQVACANDYPTIDFILSTGQNRNLNGLEGQNTDKLAIFRLKYNLFRGGSDYARKKETAYQVQEAYEVKNNTITEIKESVRLSWYAWLTAGKRLKYLKTHVNAAEATKTAYAEQFKVGKRTLLDLLDSQNEFYQAKIEALKGHYDEVYARYRILNGEGILLKFLKGRLPVGVHNNDLAHSHERINHQTLNRDVSSTPKVDLSNKPLKPIHQKEHPHPSIDKHQVNKTTMPVPAVVPQTWLVNVQKFSTAREANRLTTRLQGMSFRAFSYQDKDGSYRVYLGSYEFRAQAAEAMKSLYKRTKIKGSLVFQDNSKAIA